MIDEAGAAPAAAEPLTPSQGSGSAEARLDTGTHQAEPVIERSKETARASIERAFEAIDKQEGDAAGGQEAPKGTGEGGKGRDERGRFSRQMFRRMPGKPSWRPTRMRSARTSQPRQWMYQHGSHPTQNPHGQLFPKA